MTAADVTQPPSGHSELAGIIEAEKARRRRRIVTTWIAAAAAAALRPHPVPTSGLYLGEAVTQGDVVSLVSATGHVDARSTVNVGAQISGRVDRVLGDYNQRVNAGDVLAVFDRTALDAQLGQAVARVKASRAAPAESEVGLEEALRRQAEADALFEHHAEPETNRDALRSAAASARAQLAAARANLAVEEASLKLVRTNLGYTVIRAPIDGIVVSRDIEPGQTVAATLAAPTLFVIAADLTKMRVIAAVDEADIGRVRVGLPATFTVDAFPSEVYRASVTEVRSAAVVTQNVVTYETILDVDNPRFELRPGMTATVKIEADRGRGVLRVPNAALRFSPPGPSEVAAGPGVWVIDGRGALRRIAVRTGITDGNLTEASGPGLEQGARVLTELSLAGRERYGIVGRR